MDSTVRPAIDIGVESTSLVPPRHSSSNAYSGESSWSQMFKSGSALDRAFSRFSRKANTTLPTSIDFSTSHEPLEILQSLLDTLRKSQIPGPQLIRLRQEFNQIIGHGAQCDVLGASADAERLLRTAVLEESDSRTAAALQTYKLIAIKRTRALGDPSEVATSQGNGTRGIRDQFISAQKDINALCHGPFRRHPNIVNLHAWGLCLDTLEDPSGESPSIPLLILERADWNLSEFLQSQRRPTSSEFNVQQLRRICLDIGKGLEAIHKENMTHGDLKPDNVLVFLTQGRCIAKLCDFGLAAAEKKGDEALAEYRGTPGWRPPEASRTLSSASLVLCDVFAYGLVVWCVATLDWRSPVSESEDFGEKEIYYHAWKGVQDASVIPSGEEWNRILRVLRGSLHAAPRLRERQPWHYLDEKQFRIIGSVYDPTQDSASLLVFDLLMKVTEWASNRIDKMSKEIDTGGLDMFLSSVSISGSLNGRLRSYFAVILGALYKLGSLGMRMWGSKPTLDRQTVYEKWFIQYQTSLGSSISMDLDGITPFPHPLDYCLNIRSLKGDLHWKCLSIQQHDSNYNDTTRLIGLPGAVEDDIYALARLRSRFQLCSWEESDAILRSHDPSYSGSDVNILAEALSRIADSAILAWLCRGPIGRAEFEKCPKEVLWRSTYDRGFTRVQRLERVVLLLEMGAHVEDQVSVTEAPTSAFGRILQALVDDGPTSAQSEIPVTVCKQFKRMICNSGGLSQARFFMTGELPDQEDIDVAGGFSTTALHEAVLARCYPAVEFLLCLKFPVHVLNRNRQTPFQLAKTLAQDTTEPHQKLQSLRILALMKQKVGESDEKADLPIGWAAKKLTLGHYVYTEFYTNSITFKIPKFSLFEDRRLALGFRRITALGQTYCIDLIRFLTYDNPEADYGCLTESTTYNEAWFTKNVEETKTQLLETPTWIKFSYGLARSTSMVVWFILANSYLNLLLIFLPLSITAHLANWDYRPSLALNTLALVALCSLFDFSMQQISMRFGETGRSLAMGASESMIELLVSPLIPYKITE